MKLMIASDLHGSAAYTRRLLELYRDTGCQRLVLLGDLLYHGPRNPLPEGYEPPAVAKLLNDMADELLCVRGNCDAEVDQMVLHFPILSDSALTGDGLSTALFVMGLDKAISYWQENGGFDFILLTEDGEIYLTEGAQDCFSPLGSYENAAIHIVTKQAGAS